MPSLKRLRQLRLDLSSYTRDVSPVWLSFQINRRPVKGLLYGDYQNWTFESNSPAFLKHVPSGKLNKYAYWINAVPGGISEVYNGIFEAALKLGYSLQDMEE